MENKQVMVAKSDVADKIKSADDLKDKTVVAEKKSAGGSEPGRSPPRGGSETTRNNRPEYPSGGLR